MPWHYSQSSGRLDIDGSYLATGYAGAGPGKNNPADQATPDTGPLPRGNYTIGPAQNNPHLGNQAMPLTPHPHNQMFNRSGFWVHGDNPAHPGHSSCGCIVLQPIPRSLLASSPDRSLEVTP